MKKLKNAKRIAAAVIILFVVCIASFGIYLSFDHPGDADALATIESPSEGVSSVVTEKTIAFVPDGIIKAGVIFYPGMKIRGEAYSPLADRLAQNGYLCVLTNMPLNLSVLQSDAALSVIKDWPQVENWYIGGHSMGGLSAQKCFLENPGVFMGLITVSRQLDYDFSDINTPILGIYGNNDEICTPEKVSVNKSKANNDYYIEEMIDGGCHGYFGNYEHRLWKDNPTITREEQLQFTVSAILKFMERQS